MKSYKRLKIRGTLLDRGQLAKHVEKIASEHNVRAYSKKDTYPIENLILDYKFILETYNLLSKHLKLGIKIHSAGEWILDNFYVIEEAVKTIQKELSLKKYKNMIIFAAIYIYIINMKIYNIPTLFISIFFHHYIIITIFFIYSNCPI